MNKNEFLAFSLPYDVKAIDKFECIWTIHAYKDALDSLRDNDHLSYENFIKEEGHRLILYPLSDLTKPIEHKGEKFVPIVELLKNSSFDTSKMPEEEIASFVKVYSHLDLIALNDLPLYLQWHFDLFGGIESGEAIDVNTLDINPYK